jgi:SAM-dependent methyltransferase
MRGLHFRLASRADESWLCPVCGYRGPFADRAAPTGYRRHARCPRCGALERHRLRYLVLEELAARAGTSARSALHLAPERFLRRELGGRFGRYVTADLMTDDVDVKVDLCRLPFRDESFDLVYASHVLEHIRDDRCAIGEVWRILRRGGIAVLPVPLVAPETVEYAAPNPHEYDHWRAPGPDYFDRYRDASTSFPPEHQLFVYEDRTVFPTPALPLRPPMPGGRHVDVVPVCYK